MNRRIFLQGLSAAAAMTFRRVERAWDGPARIELGSPMPLAEAPHDFVGLSYESAQLANPEFFSPRNHELIALFRELSAQGNLRLGGGSSEFTTYSDQPPSGPPPFEVFGPDTSKTVKQGTVTSSLALRNLRGFLDATGWNCLYGLNLGQGTAENAAREAEAAHRILGSRLLAFQIGNEPDSFRNRYRPAAWGPADYLKQWNEFHSAIVERAPQAKFAGPDISNKLAYLTAFADEARKHSDVILLTSHYYAMGPAGNPAATIDNLLAPDPKLTTLKARDEHVIEDARATAKLPYRMSEGNSCWNGGQPGVSDTYASALWCADYMLTAMRRGWVGVNLHGGGDGTYSPIVGAPSTGFTRRPEFFGAKFAARFAGARSFACELRGAPPRVDAFLFERGKERELVLVNKSPESVSCDLPGGLRARCVLRLEAPAIDAKDGVLLKPVREKRAATVAAPAYTASVFELKQ